MSNKQNDEYNETKKEAEEEKELISNCRSAPVDENYMICPACQEHCDIVETE